jgi:spectrin alpha
LPALVFNSTFLFPYKADSLISSEQFDLKDIEEKRSNINDRYRHILDLAAHRQARLNEANTLHQFFRFGMI